MGDTKGNKIDCLMPSFAQWQKVKCALLALWIEKGEVKREGQKQLKHTHQIWNLLFAQISEKISTVTGNQNQWIGKSSLRFCESGDRIQQGGYIKQVKSLPLFIIIKVVKGKKSKLMLNIEFDLDTQQLHLNEPIENQKAQNHQNQRSKFAKWTASENQCYAKALKELIDDFEEEYSRRTRRVFVLISEMVKTKTPDQCRSHHQKMLKHSGTIQKIINRFSKIRNGQKKNRRGSRKEKNSTPKPLEPVVNENIEVMAVEPVEPAELAKPVNPVEPMEVIEVIEEIEDKKPIMERATEDPMEGDPESWELWLSL